MQLKSLYIKNFGTIGELELPLDKQGLLLVLGENLDAPKASSNGAGKSLLLEALCWCLWGKTIRGLKHDEVVNEKVGKDCKVAVTIEQDGKTYVVGRYRQHKLTPDENKDKNDLTLHIDGKNVSKTKMSDTQEKLDNILGMDFDTFSALMPGTAVRAAQLGDSGIKDLLDKILQTQVYAKARDLADAQLKKVTKDLVAQRLTLDKAQSAVSTYSTLVTQYTEKSASFASDLAAKKGVLLEELNTKNASIHKLDNELLILTVDIENKERAHKAYTDSLVSLRPQQESISDIDRQIVETRSEYMSDIKVLKSQIAEKRKRIEAIADLPSTCSTCLQQVTAQHKHTSAVADSLELDALNLQLLFKEQDLSTQLHSLTGAKELLQQELLRMQQESDALFKAYTNCGNPEKQKTQLDQKIAVLTSEVLRIEKEIAKLDGQLNPFISMLQEAESSLNNSQVALQAADTAVKALETKETQLQFWCDAFSTKGIRSHVLKNVTPILNEQAKKNSDLLTSGEMSVTFHTQKELKDGSTKEEFQIEVAQAHGGSSYAKNSSGERARADIVIAMTLSDLAALRTKHIPFRFLDEPFEHIDESGVSAVVSFLNEYKTRYSTIFVVTHLEGLRDLFANSITVVKEDGISRLKD